MFNHNSWVICVQFWRKMGRYGKGLWYNAVIVDVDVVEEENSMIQHQNRSFVKSTITITTKVR